MHSVCVLGIFVETRTMMSPVPSSVLRNWSPQPIRQHRDTTNLRLRNEQYSMIGGRYRLSSLCVRNCGLWLGWTKSVFHPFVFDSQRNMEALSHHLRDSMGPGLNSFFLPVASKHWAVRPTFLRITRRNLEICIQKPSAKKSSDRCKNQMKRMEKERAEK